MESRKITKQRLEYMLSNWVIFATTGDRVMPTMPNQCASVERRWNSNPSRYVWEGRAYVSRGTRETCDEPLALVVERIVRSMKTEKIRSLLMRYASQPYSVLDIAVALGLSVASAEVLVEVAAIEVWEKLEELSWPTAA